MTFEEIKKEEAEYLMPTYGRFPVALAEGKGAVAKDVDGKEYIDFTSGIGVNCLGYSDDLLRLFLNRLVRFSICLIFTTIRFRLK